MSHLRDFTLLYLCVCSVTRKPVTISASPLLLAPCLASHLSFLPCLIFKLLCLLQNCWAKAYESGWCKCSDTVSVWHQTCYLNLLQCTLLALASVIRYNSRLCITAKCIWHANSDIMCVAGGGSAVLLCCEWKYSFARQRYGWRSSTCWHRRHTVLVLTVRSGKQTVT